jgi:hypothetical protein
MPHDYKRVLLEEYKAGVNATAAALAAASATNQVEM